MIRLICVIQMIIWAAGLVGCGADEEDEIPEDVQYPGAPIISIKKGDYIQ